MINHKFIIPAFILFFSAGHLAFAADSMVDPREAAIDRAIGGMVEGSRPLLSQNYAEKNQVHKVPGSYLSPSMDTRVTASAGTQNFSNSNSVASPSGNVAGNESGNSGAGTNGTGANLGGSIHETTEPTTEPAGSGSTNDSIVNVDANVDLSGGTPAVDANLEVDTNAQGGLLDTNVGGTTDAGTTEVTVAESGQIAGQDLTSTVENALIDATLDTEVVATDIPADTEASAGLEASVDETGAGDDVAVSDPADGLSATPSL